MTPDAVVFAKTTDEVVTVVRVCSARGVPIIPFGVGTSLEGHVQAPFGGISLDLSQLNAIKSVSSEALDCWVEAGVTREQLNAHLRGTGLFFPLDPGANATLGGMAATRASGTNAVRYGTMRDATLGLTVVTPQGEIITTGSRARKSSSGYDLTRLYIGSEGTLGIITELRLRLFGVPELITAAVCQFDALGRAVDAVVAMIQSGLPLARIELLDRVQMGACIAYSKLDDLTPAETLFLEFHGSPNAVEEQMTEAAALCGGFGGSELRYARTPEERTTLWTARHNAYWAARGLRPGCEGIATDACIPISALAQCIVESREEAETQGLLAPIVGHVGDGNFHMLILFNPHDAEERDRAQQLAENVARRALSFGGTITGEHGVGLHKRTLMEEEHGGALDVMAKIKRALDPNNTLNPGKILPSSMPRP